jgi:hypothetical protein
MSSLPPEHIMSNIQILPRFPALERFVDLKNLLAEFCNHLASRRDHLKTIDYSSGKVS